MKTILLFLLVFSFSISNAQQKLIDSANKYQSLSIKYSTLHSYSADSSKLYLKYFKFWVDSIASYRKQRNK